MDGFWTLPEQVEGGDTGMSCRIRLMMEDSWWFLVADLGGVDGCRGLLEPGATEAVGLMEVLASTEARLDKWGMLAGPPLTPTPPPCDVGFPELPSPLQAGVAGRLTDLGFWLDAGEDQVDGKLALR